MSHRWATGIIASHKDCYHPNRVNGLYQRLIGLFCESSDVTECFVALSIWREYNPEEMMGRFLTAIMPRPV